MRLLDLATRTPISDAVGWTVFHSLWEGIVIAAVLAALLAAVRSPRIRYAAACLALLAMLASFIVTLIHFLPESGRGAGSLVKVTLPPWRQLSDVNGNSSVFTGLAALIPWLAPLWLMGVCFFYLRYAAGWLSLHRLRSRGLCQAPVSWQRSLARLALELKISRPVSLFESLLTDVPVVVGHFRPVVLVPLGFLTGLPTEYVEAILLHELGHISRSDYFMNICQRIAEGLLFYHPAAWWISRVIRMERENCCDDVVVALRGDAHAYARALTALEQNRLQLHRPAHEAAVAATGGSLMKRIKRLLYPKGPGGIWAPALAALVFVAGSAVATAAWQANPAAEQTNAKIESPWQ